jgi:predicted Zn-dependent protease
MLHLRGAFAAGGECRASIIRELAGNGADFFLQEFELDLTALERLYEHYVRSGNAAEARRVASPLLPCLIADARSKSGRDAGRSWRKALDIVQRFGSVQQALACAQRAATLTPDDYQSQYDAALLLCEHKRYKVAIPYLRWCLLRSPDDQALRRKLAHARAQCSQPARNARRSPHTQSHR